MEPPARPRRVLLAEQVAQNIEQEIAAGRWREWLPSERTLQRVLNVSRQTVRAALERLQASRQVVVAPFQRAIEAAAAARAVGMGVAVCSESVR